MTAYNPALGEKQHMVLINKMDLYDERCRDVDQMQASLERLGVVSLPISALTGMGLDRFRELLFERFFAHSASR